MIREDDLVQKHLKIADGLSPAQLEAKVRAYQGRDELTLTEEELAEICAIMRVHRRTTAGPPKSKAKSAPISLKDLF